MKCFREGALICGTQGSGKFSGRSMGPVSVGVHLDMSQHRNSPSPSCVPPTTNVSSSSSLASSSSSLPSASLLQPCRRPPATSCLCFRPSVCSGTAPVYSPLFKPQRSSTQLSVIETSIATSGEPQPGIENSFVTHSNHCIAASALLLCEHVFFLSAVRTSEPSSFHLYRSRFGLEWLHA